MEQLLFELTEALRWPVLALGLVALLASVVEVGVLLGELRRRRGATRARLDAAVADARAALGRDDPATALQAVEGVARGAAMADAVSSVVRLRGEPDADDRVAKHLADLDLVSLRRLERTRVLVRMGPALGLMGTLIPLSPALGALARGDVARLTDDLRVAFGITVVGLLAGALAFAVSLVRDRLYAQDLSDAEYVVALLRPGATAS